MKCLSSKALLRQPGGFEGLPLVPETLPADNFAVLESPKLPIPPPEFHLLAPVHLLVDQREHMLPCVAQLIFKRDVLPRREPGDPEAADALMAPQAAVTQVGKTEFGGIEFDILSPRLT